VVQLGFTSVITCSICSTILSARELALGAIFLNCLSVGIPY